MLEKSHKVRSEENTKRATLFDVRPRLWLPVCQQSRPRGRLDQLHNLQCPLGAILYSGNKKQGHLSPGPQKSLLCVSIFPFPVPHGAFNHSTKCLSSPVGRHLGMLTALKLRTSAPRQKTRKTLVFLRVPTLESSLNRLF